MPSNFQISILIQQYMVRKLDSSFCETFLILIKLIGPENLTSVEPRVCGANAVRILKSKTRPRLYIMNFLCGLSVRMENRSGAVTGFNVFSLEKMFQSNKGDMYC